LIGKLHSPKDGLVRFELTPDGKTYIELREDAILGKVKADPPLPSGLTKIVVNATMHLEVIQTCEASFLAGPIATTRAVADSHRGSLCDPLPSTYQCQVVSPVIDAILKTMANQCSRHGTNCL
jgi:hypothetical protein